MLHVRFGDYDGHPRDVHTFIFDTEAERRAFIYGMYSLQRHPGGPYQITEKLPNGSFAPDPLHHKLDKEKL